MMLFNLQVAMKYLVENDSITLHYAANFCMKHARIIAIAYDNQLNHKHFRKKISRSRTDLLAPNDRAPISINTVAAAAFFSNKLTALAML